MAGGKIGRPSVPDEKWVIVKKDFDTGRHTYRTLGEMHDIKPDTVRAHAKSYGWSIDGDGNSEGYRFAPIAFIASCVRRDPQAIQALVQLGKMPGPKERNKYDVSESIGAYLTFAMGEKEAHKESLALRSAEAELQKKITDAGISAAQERKSLADEALTKGEQLSAELATDVVVKMAAVFADGLDSFPTRCARPIADLADKSVGSIREVIAFESGRTREEVAALAKEASADIADGIAHENAPDAGEVADDRLARPADQGGGDLVGEAGIDPPRGRDGRGGGEAAP